MFSTVYLTELQIVNNCTIILPANTQNLEHTDYLRTGQIRNYTHFLRQV